MTTYSRPTDSQIFGASESAKYLEMLRKRFQLFLDCVPESRLAFLRKIYRCEDLGQIFGQLQIQLRQQAINIISGDNVRYEGHAVEVGVPVAYSGAAFVGMAPAARSAAAPSAKRSPRAVTRGESSPDDQVAKVDWLNFTFQIGCLTDEDEKPKLTIQDLISRLSNVLDRPVTGEDEGKGLRGYRHSVTLFAHVGSKRQPMGFIAWGGEAQRGSCLVTLSGGGCSLIEDWQAVKHLIQSLEGKVTRLDLAVDFLNGEYTVDDAVEFYKAGRFTSSGRAPCTSQAGDWLNQKERTLYIGKAKNGKVCRVYEKGHQLGNLNSDWTRYEVQFGSRDRVIPLDALTNRDAYFAGAYLILGDLMDKAGQRIATQRTEGEITLAHLIKHMRSAYGKALHCAMETEGFEIESLVEEVRVIGMPRRVKASSLEAGATWSGVCDLIKKAA